MSKEQAIAALMGGPTPAPDSKRILMQYIGAMSLLGRLTSRFDAGDDQEGIDRAFNDLNSILNSMDSEVVYARTGGGGWGAFTREQIEGINKAAKKRTPEKRVK